MAELWSINPSCLSASFKQKFSSLGAEGHTGTIRSAASRWDWLADDGFRLLDVGTCSCAARCIPILAKVASTKKKGFQKTCAQLATQLSEPSSSGR